jgi:hypothetical protein
MSPVVNFIFIALVIAVILGALNKFPELLDATTVSVIRFALLVVLGILFIDVLLWMFTGQHITHYTGGVYR